MICLGCQRHISEWSDFLRPEPSEHWHPQCWGYVDWHIDNESGGNPRPMTPDEKAAFILANKVCAAGADITS